MGNKQQRKTSFLLWTILIFLLSFWILPLHVKASGSHTVMVKHEWSPGAGTKEIKYAATNRGIELTMTTDGFQENYVVDGGNTYYLWRVHFSDGRHEYSLQCRTPDGVPGKYSMEEMECQIKIKTSANQQITSWVSVPCKHEVHGNELTWIATLPSDNSAFRDDFDVDKVVINSYAIQEYHDPVAAVESIGWTLDEEGKLTVRDMETTNPMSGLYQVRDQVKSIDLDVTTLMIHRDYFSDFENLETVTLKAKNIIGNDLSGCFRNCKNLQEVDLSELAVDGITYLWDVFQNTSPEQLGVIKAPKNLTVVCKLPTGKGAWYVEGTEEKTTILPQNTSDSVTLVWKKDESGVESQEPGVIRSVATALDGTIGLQFFVSFPGDTVNDETYAVMTLNGRSVMQTIPQAGRQMVNDYNCYYFTMPVYAKEIYDDVTLKLYDKDGNQIRLESSGGMDFTESGCQYSVAKYLQYVQTIPDTVGEKMVTLAVNMLEYGIAAKIHLDYNSEGYGLSSTTTSVTAELMEAYMATAEGSRPADITGLAFSLDLKSVTTLTMDFTFTSLDAAANYKFKVDGADQTPIWNGNTCTLQVYNIGAKDLDQIHLYTVTDLEGNALWTVNVSALTYARKAIMNGTADNDEKLTAIGQGLYLYSQAANEYFAK